MMPTLIILLKEGTDSSQGISQLANSISPCQVIAKAVRATLGACGMEKFIVDGGVSEAGETVGEGRFTPSAHIRACLHSHPVGVNMIKEIAVTVKKADKVEQRRPLEYCARTALSSN
uniref:Uncharacterized protein n=1 Tax=Theropithecus gelada TaxID=9565 RepID=A0A8D2GFU5_THEGE